MSSRPKNFPAAHSTDGVSRQDEQSVPSDSERGQRGYSNREKKLADLPKFERGNERSSARELDSNARRNQNLWSDPDPDLSENAAAQQVFGSGEEFNEGQGQRSNEQDHDDAPGARHFQLESDEIQSHQDAIVDKHAPSASIFNHKSRSKDAYALAARSKSTRGKKN